MRRLVCLGVLVMMALPSRPAAAQSAGTAPAAVSAADVASAIDRLGVFDLGIRTEASRTVRRAAAEVAVPALARAARDHKDGYVRYRALVLLAGFGDAPAAEVMRQVMTDRNDRLRAVAYAWFEHHRDASLLPGLIDALGREQSEFVRPALLRAMAAYGDDARARAAVTPIIMRGPDAFRGTLIEALGDYRATYAVAPIIEVSKLDGPLQNDAITALGKIGDQAAYAPLAELQRNGPKEIQPAVAAALCLLGASCGTNEDYLKKSLAFGATNDGYQPLLRGAAHGLAVLAVRGTAGALTALFDAGGPATDPARSSVALAVGLVALRNPAMLLDVLEPRADRSRAIDLLRDAFDMLSSEDYALERFYVEVRHTYWTAAAGSARRQLADALIRTLEF